MVTTVEIKSIKKESRRYGLVVVGERKVDCSNSRPSVVGLLKGPASIASDNPRLTTGPVVARGVINPDGEEHSVRSGRRFRRKTPSSVSPSMAPATAGELSAQASQGPPTAAWSLESHVEDIKLVHVPGRITPASSLFQNFPYKGAHDFRNRLLAKRDAVASSHHDGRFLDRLCYVSDCLSRLPGSSDVESVLDPSPPSSRFASSNRFSVLAADPDECKRKGALRACALGLVKQIKLELGLTPLRGSQLPGTIECGQLRSVVRSLYPRDLPEIAELSIKTAQKLESNCCGVCKPRFDILLDKWKSDRFKPVADDPAHRERFRRAFAANVDQGWNKGEYPYIPNGHATLNSSRMDGGNWNSEEFSPVCRAGLVFSSGKPRVVTLYSSFNTQVLTPLHLSLYERLKRKGWLLTGPPTEDRVAGLNGNGDYYSFDYVGATDRLKSTYVRDAIEILISRADGLSTVEEQCLRVLGELRLDECPDSVACTGQPMGSVMSFPLLCLFNKAVVDLALVDMMDAGKITFTEFAHHRCLINGDDLLLREVRAGRSDLFGGIRTHGSAVGFLVNEEKSMRSPDRAEINSTLFVAGKLEKKSNLSAIRMKPDVGDVLGFASESASTLKGFKRLVRVNARLLARQDLKYLDQLTSQQVAVCRKNRRIRKALLSEPTDSRIVEDRNFFPVDVRPVGYDLSRSEEIAVINDRVLKVRGAAIKLAGRVVVGSGRSATRPSGRSWRSLLREKKTRVEEDLILKCLVDYWKGKQKDARVEEDRLTSIAPEYCLPPSDAPNLASAYVDAIRGFKARNALSCVQPLALADMGFESDDELNIFD
jgi:hypothetical protein